MEEPQTSGRAAPGKPGKPSMVPLLSNMQKKEEKIAGKKKKKEAPARGGGYTGGHFHFDDDGAPMSALPPVKQKRNPLVLVGAVVTAGVLGAGLISFYQGNKVVAQSMMRWRVIAQGATVAIMVSSIASATPGDAGAGERQLEISKMVPKTVRDYVSSLLAPASLQGALSSASASASAASPAASAVKDKE